MIDIRSWKKYTGLSHFQTAYLVNDIGKLHSHVELAWACRAGVIGYQKHTGEYVWEAPQSTTLDHAGERPHAGHLIIKPKLSEQGRWVVMRWRRQYKWHMWQDHLIIGFWKTREHIIPSLHIPPDRHEPHVSDCQRGCRSHSYFLCGLSLPCKSKCSVVGVWWPSAWIPNLNQDRNSFRAHGIGILIFHWPSWHILTWPIGAMYCTRQRLAPHLLNVFLTDIRALYIISEGLCLKAADDMFPVIDFQSIVQQCAVIRGNP